MASANWRSWGRPATSSWAAACEAPSAARSRRPVMASRAAMTRSAYNTAWGFPCLPARMASASSRHRWVWPQVSSTVSMESATTARS
ncbi:hypothetical protein ACFFX0_26820 [Citricoccus parietis]|uniref:Secreted protein n=1 Tax=Citricoccus parietis TaxID=592307 RepID=A0ABV5G6M1_9MICC